MKRIIAVILSAFMLVVALTACDESVGTSEGVSEPSASSTSESESSVDESQDDTSKPSLGFETGLESAYTVITDGTFHSDTVMYSKFGENVYAAGSIDGVIGTVKSSGGLSTAFYPEAFNMYEKDGIVYGVVSEGENYTNVAHYYCRFNDDGNYEKLFDCWKAFYYRDKVYFFDTETPENEEDTFKGILCCANIDGSGRKTLVKNLPISISIDDMFIYKDSIIYEADGGSICRSTLDGDVTGIIDLDLNSSSSHFDIEFVNGGFVYYVVYNSESIGDATIRNNTYSLWRVPLEGGDSELVTTEKIEGSLYGIGATAFGGKLLVFKPDGVYVYTENFMDSSFYSYKDFKYEDIAQVAVIGDYLSVTFDYYSLKMTRVYDIEGNLVFDSSKIHPAPEPVPEKNIVASPLLFWDTTDNRSDQAYIIGAFNKDGFHTTREFPYNDRHLNDYIEEVDGETVETNIIDTSKTLRFYDRNGSFFEADCGKIRCYSEAIIGEAHICADVKSDIPIDSQRFLGTYNGVDIFPESIEYSGNSITVDLDCDGDNEVVKWQFEDAYGEYSGGDYYHYSLTAVIDGKTVGISDNYDWLPLEKGDFEVFIADVDMDGKFEIIVYEKGTSIFSNILIYDVSSKGTELIHGYTISPMP